MIITQLLIGSIILILTVIIHAYALDKIITNGKRIESLSQKITKKNCKIPLVTIVILLVFSAHVIQMWLWAFAYLIFTDEFTNIEQAIYLSISSFTTVGFGDIVMSEKWRILSGVEAANGFILFGWSTAFIFEIIAQIYRREAKNIKNDKQ